MAYDLLPSNATAFERSFSLSADILEKLSPGVGAIRTAKLVTVPETFLPFLIYEYGLGEVSPYVPDPRVLLATGLSWQRVRGTRSAMAVALDWLGYVGAIEDAPTRRARWNLFQLALARVRDAEAPDLENIEGVAALSVPARSHFWRGYSGHDVREAEWSRKKWGGARWSASSGARLRDGGAKWSFGRTYDFFIPLGQSVLDPLGAWFPDAGGGLSWDNIAWNATPATWQNLAGDDRVKAITEALSGRPIYAVFRTASGGVIGYRRARVARPVAQSVSGPYQVGSKSYDTAERRAIATGDGDGETVLSVAGTYDFMPEYPDAPTVNAGGYPGTVYTYDRDPTAFYVEVLTGFGDGNGSTAATVSLIWDAVPADGPGQVWCGPGGLATAGTEVLSVPVTIPFGRTVRERLRFSFTF